MKTCSFPIHRLAGLTRLLFITAACLAAIAGPLAGAQEVYLEIETHGLEDLGFAWAYEGWFIVDGVAVSTGIFTVDGSGMPSQSRFRVEVDNPDAIATFVLTIEPVPDDDPAPAAVHLLAGDLADSTAQLTAGHPAALGDDFTSAAGPYILNAPSGGDGVDYRNGIWWLDPDAGPGPSLELPALPAGWAYEGWVVGPEGPISTGRFTSAEGADSDAGGLTAGPFGTPPFPGQDLLNPPMDLTAGYAAVLSVEPDPDNSPAPFTLKPLVDGEVDDVGAGVLQTMDNMASSFPTGMISIRTSEVMSEVARLRLSSHGLEDLGPDFAYEGWLIVDGAPVSTGTFTVSSGVASETFFPTAVSSIDAIVAFVLTIEPVPDADPSPSTVHLLGGDFASGSARLTVDHGAALGTGFNEAAGSYILAAPSGGGAAAFSNGIWWLDPDAGPGPSLVLPELPDGWVYEGWVAAAEGPISTGRFSSAQGEDSDGTGPDAGPEPGPLFPGQDFVDPALDLTAGYAAVISVEPEPDNSTAPFTIKPLFDPNIDDVGEGILQPMGRNIGSLPGGMAVLVDDHYIAAAAHLDGVNESVWRTDLDLANGGSQSAAVEVELLRADQANLEPERASVVLAPYSSVRYFDAVDTLFSTEGVGALRILAGSEVVTSSSRTFNDEVDGTFGQGIPSQTAEDAVRYGQVGRLTGLSQSGSDSSGFRTNIGLLNLGAGSITVSVDLYSGEGTFIRSITENLEAFEQTQINGIYPEAIEVGYAEVWTSTPGGAFLAYASVVDNISGDPTYIAVR